MTIYTALFTTLAFTFACADSQAVSDAPALDPAGRYALHGAYTLPAAPPAAAPALAALAERLDDPSRYLVDLVIARLPDGETKRIASALAPYVAAYVDTTIPPRVLDGVRALGGGLVRVATRFGTHEELLVTPDGRALRTIVGITFDAVEVPYASPTASASVALTGDRLAIGDHVVMLDYGELVRLGFDRAVIPSIAPAATELGEALRELVDCTQLGALIAEWIGVGSGAFYAQACTVGLNVAAAKIYDELPEAVVQLEVSGSAQLTARALESGAWIGTIDRAPLGLATFAGERQ